MAVPSIVATSTASATDTASTSLTINVPGSPIEGDSLVVFLRHQTAISSTSWSSAGWTSVGPAFEADSSGKRVVSILTKKYHEGDPTSYTFSGVELDTGSPRRIGSMFLIRSDGDITINSSSPSYGGASVTNGRTAESWNTTSDECLLLFCGTNEVTSGNASNPTTTPSGYIEQVNEATSTNTTISRTCLWVGSKSQATAGSTGDASITWSYVAGANAVAIALHTTEVISGPTELPVITDSAYGYIASKSGPQTLTLPAIPVGSWVILALHQSHTYSDGIMVPTWTPILEPTTMNTRRVSIYATIYDGSGSVDISWSASTTSAGWVLVWGTGSSTVADWLIGEPELRSQYGSAPRNWARCPSVNVSTSQGLALAIAFEATNAIENPDEVLSYDNGFNELVYRPQGGVLNSRIETIWVGSKEVLSGPTGITTVLYQNPQDSNGLGLHIVIPSSAVDTIDVENGEGDSVEAWLWDGSTELALSQIMAIPANKRSFTISQMDAMIANNETVYWAHRGGSADWSEMTMRAYTNAIWWGAKALEVSCRQSSDGVFIMSHDNTMERTTADTSTISTTNSSLLLGVPVDTPITGGVVGRLEDLLEAYPDIIILADRKAQGNMTNFFNMLKTVPDWQEHVIVKFDGQWDKTTGSTAYAQGFKTCAYLYDTNYADHLESILPYVDYLGLNYNASQTIWDEFVSTGKVLWGHVCPNQSTANTAIAKGASIIQCSGVKAIIPRINSV